LFPLQTLETQGCPQGVWSNVDMGLRPCGRPQTSNFLIFQYVYWMLSMGDD